MTHDDIEMLAKFLSIIQNVKDKKTTLDDEEKDLAIDLFNKYKPNLNGADKETVKNMVKKPKEKIDPKTLASKIAGNSFK